MTRIRVGSNVYGLEESVNDAALGDLLVLKTKTKTAEFSGVSIKTIADTFTSMGKRAEADDFSPMDLLDDELFIVNMIGIAYLARRKAGEQITYEDAARVSFTELEILVDEEDDAPKGEAADAA